MIKKLASVGNSRCVILDRSLLDALGVAPTGKVEILVRDGTLLIRPAPIQSQGGRIVRRRRQRVC